MADAIKTESDEANELEVSVGLELLLHAPVALADLEEEKAPYDLIIHTQPKGFVEVKRRYLNHDKHPTTIVPFNKVMRIVDACSQYKAYALFVFWFNDGLFCTDLQTVLDSEIGTVTRKKPRVSGVWTRTDRGHQAYFIDVKKLVPFKDIKFLLPEGV